MNTNATRLDAAPRTDAASNHLTRFALTLGDEQVFQDVDQWGLHDNLCDRPIITGRLDADALNAL